jgi:hypothetical protein
MAGHGKQLDFHGAFATKAKAVAKERSVPGGFIRRTKIKGKVRYIVFSRPDNPGSSGGFRLPNLF